jgi:hypothetical protein
MVSDARFRVECDVFRWNKASIEQIIVIWIFIHKMRVNFIGFLSKKDKTSVKLIYYPYWMGVDSSVINGSPQWCGQVGEQTGSGELH